jgi:hypothetical protein
MHRVISGRTGVSARSVSGESGAGSERVLALTDGKEWPSEMHGSQRNKNRVPAGPKHPRSIHRVFSNFNIYNPYLALCQHDEPLKIPEQFVRTRTDQTQ